MHNTFSSAQTLQSESLARFVSFLLIIAFLLPPQLVIAQDVGGGETPPADAPAEDAPPSDDGTGSENDPLLQDLFSAPTENSQAEPSAEPALPEETSDEEDKGDEPPAPSLLDSGGGDTPPTISNTNLFSYQTLLPKVDGGTGALIQKIPLEIPPGRTPATTPEVALQYNSQELADEIAGYGWTLSIPYIERLNKVGSQALYSNTYFRSSLGGELASTTVANEFRHRIEDGRFITYTFANNTWTAYDKNGTRYYFGSTTAAQQSATSSTSNVNKWMLEEVRDTNNNYIKFEYAKNYNQIYPSKITYTGNGTTDGLMTVDFTYATRTDSYISYKPGFKVTTYWRLTQVLASVNGSWLRKYDLSYSAGHNTLRSLLSSVRETGRDSGGTELALPALSFSYSSTTPTYTAHTNKEVYNAARSTADQNGNGLPDLYVLKYDLCGGSDAVHRYYSLNSYPSFTDGDDCPVLTAGDYWSLTSSWEEGYAPVELGVRMFDINGDGMADIVRGYKDNTTATTSRYYEKQSGETWNEVTTSTTTIPVFAYNNGTNTYSTGLLGNVNGDGLIDYVLALNGLGANQPVSQTFLHTSFAGSTWTGTTTIFAAVNNMVTDPLSASSNELVDINGDGLDDWVKSTGGTTSFCLNTGTGWDTSCTSPWTIATSTRHANGWDRGIRFIDINGDALPDYVRSYTMPSYSSHTAADNEIGSWNYVYLNTGTGWATSTITTPEYIFNGNHLSTGIWTGKIEYNEMVDWNGDGIPDQAANTSTSTGIATQDILNRIVYPTLGTTTINYKLTPQLADVNPNLPAPVLVVTDITDDDGIGAAKTARYTYEGGKLYLSINLRDRRFATFKLVTKTDELGTTKTWFNQGDTTDTASSEQTDSYAQIGKPYREDIISNASTTMRQTLNKWTTVDQGDNGRNFVYLEKQLVEDWDGNNDHRDRASEFTYSTTTGNLTLQTDLGEVVGSSDGTYVDIDSDAVTKSLMYAASSSVNMSVLSAATTTNYGGTRVKETKYTYDNLAFGSVNKGNVTKEENWISGSTYASSTSAYNSYGLIATSTDPRVKSTTYVYDTYNFNVATATNPLSQTTAFTYDYATGKPATIKDANSRTRQFTYDPVGRLTEKKVPDPTSGSAVTETAITYTDGVLPSKTQETRSLNSATSTDRYSYFDGFGRAIQQRTEGSTNYITVDTVYGSRGLVATSTLPYFSSGSSRTAATTTTSLMVGPAHQYLLRRP
jgi:YD repeat-containing protein